MTAPHSNDNRSNVARRELNVNVETLGGIVENPKCLIPWPNPNPNPNPDVNKIKNIKSRHCNLTLTDVAGSLTLGLGLLE